MAKLFWFPSPLDSKVELRHDADGIVRVFKPDTHPSGRTGQSIELPDSLPNKNGARVIVSGSDYFDSVFRGVLDLTYFDYDTTLKGIAGLLVDDCILIKKPAPCPEIPVPPIPPVNPGTDPSLDPFTIIKAVYATGLYDLNTKDGCGKFTEACCDVLHKRHSVWWGHIKKQEAQNQYNKHAVDAIQLMFSTPNCAGDVFDIIKDSESPRAEPAFNSKGPSVPTLWYYPA